MHDTQAEHGALALKEVDVMCDPGLQTECGSHGFLELVD